jgi:hypothetical protein
MGTNYYCYKKYHESKHIGKKSCGWAFIFHGYDEFGFKATSYDEWKKFLLNNEVDVFDEYHEKVEIDELFKMIDESISEKKHPVENNMFEWSDELNYSFLNNEFS